MHDWRTPATLPGARTTRRPGPAHTLPYAARTWRSTSVARRVAWRWGRPVSWWRCAVSRRWVTTWVGLLVSLTVPWSWIPCRGMNNGMLTACVRQTACTKRRVCKRAHNTVLHPWCYIFESSCPGMSGGQRVRLDLIHMVCGLRLECMHCVAGNMSVQHAATKSVADCKAGTPTWNGFVWIWVARRIPCRCGTGATELTTSFADSSLISHHVAVWHASQLGAPCGAWVQRQPWHTWRLGARHLASKRL